jgi:hypothetical protein
LKHSQRIDADDAEELLETSEKVGWSEVHAFHQSIDPVKSGIVHVVQSHKYQEDVLLDRTEGVVEERAMGI